jgi:hypothetical protein
MQDPLTLGAGQIPQRHVARESDLAQGQTAQALGVPTWGRGSGSRPGQGKPAPAPRGARV